MTLGPVHSDDVLLLLLVATWAIAIWGFLKLRGRINRLEAALTAATPRGSVASIRASDALPFFPEDEVEVPVKKRFLTQWDKE